MAMATAGLSRPLAGRRLVPLWAIVHHVGRRSGTSYSTPVAIIRIHDGFLIPVPFGPSTQWPRNVLAAGGCRIRWQGRDYATVDPEIINWVTAKPMAPRRFGYIIPITGIDTFLRLREA
jgi:deazaflavin-dependent oxidoreductase (nitroreductase family)